MSSRSRFGLIVVIWVAGLAAAGQYGKISVAFDLLPEMYPMQAAQLGWSVSLVGLVGLFFGVIAGSLVSSLGFRRTLIWSLWVGALMSAFQAATPNFGLFLVSRFVEGASHLGLVVAAPTLIAQISSDRHRGAALTLWSTFFGASFAILAWVGRPFATVQGIEMLFALHGAIMAVMAVWLARAMRDVRVPERLPMPSLISLARQHLNIYRSAHRMTAASGWLFYTSSFVAILTVLPPFLDESVRSFVMGTMPLVSITVSMTVGVALLRVMSGVGVVILGFGLSFAAVGWLWMMPGHPTACLALAAAMGLVQGASFAAVPQINHTAEHQAEANGVMSQAGNLGNTIGTPLTLFAIGTAGYAGLMMVSAILFAGGLFIHLVLAQARRAS